MISLYSNFAKTAEEKEKWIRHPAMLVLIYEGIVEKVLDYDYAPMSRIVEARRKYFNISQEGISDIDFLRDMATEEFTIFDAISLKPSDE